MIGGWFDQHPGRLNALIINEIRPSRSPTFSQAFVKYDEIYQPKEWSRDKVNVLPSLDFEAQPHKQPPPSDGPRFRGGVIKYTAKAVFYSTLGHTEEA